MQYMLMTYVPEDGWNKLTPYEQERGMAAYMAFTEALAKAGALKSSGRLQPISAATTIRAKDEKTQVLDGPYLDSKEHGRLLLHRRGRPRCGHRLGRALRSRAPRGRRDTAALAARIASFRARSSSAHNVGVVGQRAGPCPTRRVA